MQDFSDLEQDIRQARLWILESEALSEQAAELFELYRVSWKDPLVRHRLLVFHRGASFRTWLVNALNEDLKEQPETWCSGLICKWGNYRYAPSFYKYVLEPRFRSDPADFLWVIETAYAREREPSRRMVALGIICRFLNELILTAEELAGRYTYEKYGPMMNESDKNYWKIRQEAYSEYGLDLRGGDFAHKVLPGIDEVLSVLLEGIG